MKIIYNQGEYELELNLSDSFLFMNGISSLRKDVSKFDIEGISSELYNEEVKNVFEYLLFFIQKNVSWEESEFGFEDVQNYSLEVSKRDLYYGVHIAIKKYCFYTLEQSRNIYSEVMDRLMDAIHDKKEFKAFVDNGGHTEEKEIVGYHNNMVDCWGNKVPIYSGDIQLKNNNGWY